MAERPNVLVVIVHDLGAHLGCYGVSGVQSLRLDRLAASGARFDQYYCTAAFCSPSRGAIFTGKYAHVNGLMGLVNLGWDLPAHNTTLSQMLSGVGYETFLFGLQHEVKDNERLETLFDHVGDRSVGNRCERVVPGVVDFLKTRDSDRPFYARVGFSEVHRGYDSYEPGNEDDVIVPQYLEDTPGARQDFAMFHGAIAHMDAAVGQILDALDESGQADNTLVIFTVDHGIAFPRAKSTLYDAGLQTALLMRWPGQIAEGMVCSELLSHVDLLPTVLDLVGAPVPDDIQGRSFSPLLTGGNYVPREWVFAGKNTNPDDVKRCIRTGRYKYIRNYDDGPILKMPTDIEASLTRRDMGDAHLAPRPEVELYDLEKDPLEQNNLAGQENYADVERKLRERLHHVQVETDDPILKGPISRPPEEAEIINRNWERAQRIRAERDRA